MMERKHPVFRGENRLRFTNRETRVLGLALKESVKGFLLASTFVDFSGKVSELQQSMNLA